MERWRSLQLDVNVRNLHLAVASIWPDEKLDAPATLSVHLPQLTLASTTLTGMSDDVPTAWKLRLSEAAVHATSRFNASLFPMFARHSTTTPSFDPQHRLLSGFGVDGSLLLHAGDGPSSSLTKVELNLAIEGGETKITADSLATCRYLLASLKGSLLSLRRAKPNMPVDSPDKPQASLIAEDEQVLTLQLLTCRTAVVDEEAKCLSLLGRIASERSGAAVVPSDPAVSFCGVDHRTTDRAHRL
jgi:hypothetical protein